MNETESERKVIVVDEELHRRAKMEAARQGISLKELIERLLKTELAHQE